MPFNVSDAKKSFVNRLDNIVKIALSNPITASLTITIIVCIILMWIFRNDTCIKHRGSKVFTIFVYAFISTTVVIFLQNSYIFKNKTTVVDPFELITGSARYVNDGDYVPVNAPATTDSSDSSIA